MKMYINKKASYVSEKKHFDEQQDSGGDIWAHRRIRAPISRVCVYHFKKALPPGLKKDKNICSAGTMLCDLLLTWLNARYEPQIQLMQIFSPPIRNADESVGKVSVSCTSSLCLFLILSLHVNILQIDLLFSIKGIKVHCIFFSLINES